MVAVIGLTVLESDFCPAVLNACITAAKMVSAIQFMVEVTAWAMVSSSLAMMGHFRETLVMTHKRLRKFNTRDTYPEQNLDNDLCQAVITHGGKTVYLRGQCPQNLEDAANLDSHDPVEQTHKVMQNIRQLISEAGGNMQHLVKVVVYITDVRHREAVYRTMGEYIQDVYPVSTGLVVSALARPEWLVEIDATAVIPE